MTLSLPYRFDHHVYYQNSADNSSDNLLLNPFSALRHICDWIGVLIKYNNTSQYGIRRCGRPKFESRLFGDMRHF